MIHKEKNFRKLVIIPVHSEIGKIGKVLSKFTNSTVDEICLVLDAPTEADLDEIEIYGRQTSVPIHMIKNGVIKGVGYAIREGIIYALENGFDIIVVMAGNNKDDPREIPRLLAPIVKEDCDYVQGSRFMYGGRHKRTPIFRKFFSRMYPHVWNLLTKSRCTEITNGFRAYKSSLFSDKRINIWQSWLDHYGLEYYLHYKVTTLGYKVKEVPVSKMYPYGNKGGYSKISPLKDWWDIVSPLIYLKLGARR
ncbi:MAG: glycosyltransferase family 2 protein [Candidatus Bathyarchaeota archaeon]|jgi:dolichol-phosphate mannosyltransferase